VIILIDLNIHDYYYYNNNSDDDEFNGPVLCLECRDRDENPHYVRILDKEVLSPVFGILLSEYEEKKHELNFFNEITKIDINAPDAPYGEKTVRIYTTFPWEVGKLVKRKIDEDTPYFTRTFTGDVKWEKLAMSKIIDVLGLEGPYVEVPDDYYEKFLKVSDMKKVEKKDFFITRSRVWYFDIESDARDCGDKIEFEDYKDMPILSISGYDNYEDEYHCFVWKPEFINRVEEYDNYRIMDNIDPSIIHSLRKVFMHKFNNEIACLIEYLNWFGSKRFNLDMGFNSFGGIGTVSKKGDSYKRWFDGYDLNHIFERSKHLGLFENLQSLSSCPIIPKKYTGYEGVYLRSNPNKGKMKHEVVTKGLGHVDIIYSNEALKFTDKFQQFRGSGLKDYSEFFLKYHKLDKKGKKVWQWWEEDVDFMIDYNIIDVKICVDLDSFFSICEKQRNKIIVPISPFYDALQASNLHDHYKLTKYQNKYALDTKYQKYYKPRKITGKKQIYDKFTITLKDLEDQAKSKDSKVVYESLDDVRKVGGLVIEPIEGIHKNIIRIDFEKFYARVIQALNIGIVSAVDVEKEYWFCVKDKRGIIFDRKDLVECPNAYYRKDVNSINKELFDDWIKNETVIKKQLKEYVEKHKTTNTDKYKIIEGDVINIKGFRNAAFGVVGLEIDRIFSKEGFNSITISCQDLMYFVLYHLRRMIYKILLNDTDSAALFAKSQNLRNCEYEGKNLCYELNSLIKDYLKRVYNVDTDLVKLDLEVIVDKAYVSGKKHYVFRCPYKDGVWLNKPELEVKGMDLKKRATSQIGADNQINLINCLFDYEEPEEGMTEYIKKTDRNLKNMKWSYLCKRGPLRKELEKYPDSNQSATAARNMYKYFGKYFGPGSNPYLGVFSKFPKEINGIRVDENENMVLSFDSDDEDMLKSVGFELSLEDIRNTQCQAKTDQILSLIGTSWSELVSQSETGGFLML